MIWAKHGKVQLEPHPKKFKRRPRFTKAIHRSMLFDSVWCHVYHLEVQGGMGGVLPLLKSGKIQDFHKVDGTFEGLQGMPPQVWEVWWFFTVWNTMLVGHRFLNPHGSFKDIQRGCYIVASYVLWHACAANVRHVDLCDVQLEKDRMRLWNDSIMWIQQVHSQYFSWIHLSQ